MVTCNQLCKLQLGDAQLPVVMGSSTQSRVTTRPLLE
jgi:hypothetical protein